VTICRNDAIRKGMGPPDGKKDNASHGKAHRNQKIVAGKGTPRTKNPKKSRSAIEKGIRVSAWPTRERKLSKSGWRATWYHYPLEIAKNEGRGFFKRPTKGFVKK